jgi:signal transduction histidine kinase/DNA-binding response OmpR family regulator
MTDTIDIVSPATILIVDDLPANRRFLVTLLAREGYRILEAENGGDGLAVAKKEKIDLVITDVLMPVMDGYEFVRLLRLDPMTSAIPVVFHTAHYGEREARALARTRGPADVLTKPAGKDEVLRIVGSVLSRESKTEAPPEVAPPSLEFNREHLQLLSHQASERAEDQRTANARLRAMINIGLDFASGRDSELRLDSLCASVCDLFSATYITLGIVDRNDRTLKRFFSCGADATARIETGEVLSGVLAQVVSERRTISGENPGGDPASLKFPWNGPEVQTFIAAPIAAPSHVYGWICLVGNDRTAFTEEDENLVMALAGQVGRIYALEHEILERKHAEAALRHERDQARTVEERTQQAHKMEAIGRLASGVAHDFNNLLTVILGFAELLKEENVVVSANQHGKDVAEIIKAAQRASGLTKQLLAFSRQQVLHATALDVNGLITEMSGMLESLIGEHIDVSLALAPKLRLALADRTQLEQVVMNLVVNARDAMPDGGRLTIETTDVELENSSFHDEVMMQGRYVMIAVTDTGSGMTKETKQRVFEPFFTTKGIGRGTGLGLSTTYGIVKQSKGYIWVYSELGRGTTFKVYLPCADSDVALDGASSVVIPTHNGSGTVLLVEDEEGVRRLSKRILVAAGYHVLESANGDEAESLFEQNADTIDLVVTDVIMPGCGGPELLSRLRARTPDIKVLYMSGYTDLSAAHQVGVDHQLPYVQKPFTAAELVRHVRAALVE